MDYYFTVKDGLGVEDAERVFEEFERDHYEGWDLEDLHPRIRVSLRGQHFGTNKTIPALASVQNSECHKTHQTSRKSLASLEGSSEITTTGIVSGIQLGTMSVSESA